MSATRYGTWRDIERHAVDTSTIVLHPSAAVADPQAEIETLARIVEAHCGYPRRERVDVDCMKIARKMCKRSSASKLIVAFKRLDARNRFFVEAAATSGPGFQVEYVVAEAKRADAPKRTWYAGMEGFVNR